MRRFTSDSPICDAMRCDASRTESVITMLDARPPSDIFHCRIVLGAGIDSCWCFDRSRRDGTTTTFLSLLYHHRTTRWRSETPTDHTLPLRRPPQAVNRGSHEGFSIRWLLWRAGHTSLPSPFSSGAALPPGWGSCSPRLKATGPRRCRG